MRIPVRITAVLLAFNMAAACSSGTDSDGRKRPSGYGMAGPMEAMNSGDLPPLAEIYVKVGQKALQHGHPETARRFFEKAAEVAPDRARRRTVAAAGPVDRPMDGNRPAGHVAGAMQATESASDLYALSGAGLMLLFEHPKDSWDSRASLHRTAISYDFFGEHVLAQRTYREALKADADNPALRHNLAISLAMSGASDQAVREMSRVTASPSASHRHFRTLSLLLQLASQDKAMPGSSPVVNRRGRALDLVQASRALEATSPLPAYIEAIKPAAGPAAPAGGGTDSPPRGFFASLFQGVSDFWARLQASVRPVDMDLSSTD